LHLARQHNLYSLFRTVSKTLIIFAHPSHDSFNSSLLENVVAGLGNNGHEIRLDDLCAVKFDPVMTSEELSRTCVPDNILEEQAKVSWADRLVFIFPIWWWGPPAILKGWLERVLCLNFAFRYDVKQGGFVGLLDGRRAVVISTSSADAAAYESTWQTESQNNYVSAILMMSGVSVIKQMNFCNVHAYSSPSDLNAHLLDVQEYMQSL
jgi:NAD(P)H dehydrogenase (quinone)